MSPVSPARDGNACRRMVWTWSESECPELKRSVNCPVTAWATIVSPMSPATYRGTSEKSAPVSTRKRKVSSPATVRTWIGIWGSGDRQAAAWKITIYLALGSFILLIGLIGSVIGGWMASGEPMTLALERRRDLVTHETDARRIGVR